MKSERQIQAECLALLERRPDLAWGMRQNVVA